MSKNNDDFLDDENVDATELPRPAEDLLKKVTELEAQVQEQADKLLRAYAEMENTRRRAKLDVQEAHQFGLKKIMMELLPVVDALEQSLTVPVDANALAFNMRQGIEMTLSLFLNALSKFNVEVQHPEGELCNPDFHSVVQSVDDAEKPAGTIVSVLQKGYTLQGRLLRPAMVVIVK